MGAYADDVVMWTWLVALLGTLVLLALAWRHVARAEHALARARSGLGALDEVAAAGADLDAATRETAGERLRLHTRASEV